MRSDVPDRPKILAAPNVFRKRAFAWFVTGKMKHSTAEVDGTSSLVLATIILRTIPIVHNTEDQDGLRQPVMVMLV